MEHFALILWKDTLSIKLNYSKTFLSNHVVKQLSWNGIIIDIEVWNLNNVLYKFTFFIFDPPSRKNLRQKTKIFQFAQTSVDLSNMCFTHTHTHFLITQRVTFRSTLNLKFCKSLSITIVSTSFFLPLRIIWLILVDFNGELFIVYSLNLENYRIP